MVAKFNNNVIYIAPLHKCLTLVGQWRKQAVLSGEVEQVNSFLWKG